VAMAGTLGVTGDITLSNIAGGAVFNEAGADVDFRVESDTVDHALFVDGATGNVGIGTSSPDADLSLISPVYSSGGTGNGIRFQNQNNNADAIIQSYYSGTSSSALITGSNVYLSTGASFTSFDGTKPSSYVLQNTNGNIEFANASSGNPTSKMLIDSSGNVFYGCTALPDGSADGVSLASTQSQRRFSINATSNSNQILFYNGNGLVGLIGTNGSATAYATSSDYRLKENVTTSWDATTRLKQLKPSRFNFIADADTTVDGFLAHEVQEIVPEAITGTKDAVEVWKDGEELPDGVSVGDNKLDDDGNTIPVMQGIDQSKLVPLLVKTIQELEARITALENA